MGALSSAFPLVALRSMFSSTGKIGLGSSASTEISGSGYSDVAGSNASWAFTTTNGRATVTNSAKVYFPEATASYANDVSHILFKNTLSGSTPILYTIELGTDISVSINDRVKINRYVSGSSRGVRVQLWEVT